MELHFENFESNVRNWVSETFKNRFFKNINIEICGTSGIGDGLTGNIVFITVTAVSSDQKVEVFNLALKISKQNKELREKIPIRIAYEREIFVYSEVVPAFRQLEKKRNVKFLDTFLPKCYNTFSYENQEILIFQDLRTLGFELHDKFKPLNLNHLRLTLENYGKWHGLSMVFRDQNLKKFQELFGNLPCVMEIFLTMVKDPIQKTEEGLYDILEKKNELELSRKLKERFPDGFTQKLRDLLKVKEANSVLIHGDCWNNNMLFQYADSNKTRPQASRFVDFQMSKLGAPALDLSHHLYSTASEEELGRFKELLNIYYSSLSSTIRSLGSDPETLFPYSELVRQWKIYSSFGVIMATFVLPIAISNKEVVADIGDINGDHMSLVVEQARLKYEDILSSRSIAFVKHFLNFNDF